MALLEVVWHEQWLEARLKLPAQEKELTRRRDALNAERRRLPIYTSDFNYDFGVTLDRAAGQVSYNYRAEPGLADGEKPRAPAPRPGPAQAGRSRPRSTTTGTYSSR